MRIPDQPTQIRRMLDARRARLSPKSPTLAGTLSRIAKRCGQPSCRCNRGQPHTAWQLTYKVQQKTRTVYIPLALVDQVQAWVQEHKRIKNLLDEIHQLTVALIRTHTQHHKRNPGRP